MLLFFDSQCISFQPEIRYNLQVGCNQTLLLVCCRERQNQAKINRRLDKKTKEYTLMIEDERRTAEQHKDQVSALLHIAAFC